MSFNAPNMEDRTDWDFIVDTIKRGKCVLFIGPEAFENRENEKIDKALSKFLGAKNEKNPYIRKYYDSDGFYLFRDEKFRPRVITQMRKFYEEFSPATRDMFEKIASIPFNIVISLNPDNFLSKTYQINKIAHQFNYYHKNKPGKPLIKPADELPVIYNLFGYLEEYDSLVLTHNDFFDYLHSIFKGKSMDLELKNNLLEAQNYIFLGLPYDRWYMQLLLRVLSLHVSDAFFARFSPANSIHQETMSFYAEQFKIEFVPYGIPSFVNEIYTRCEAEGVLRQSQHLDEEESSLPTLDNMVEAIAYGYTDKALDQLKKYLESQGNIDAEVYGSVIVLLSRYRKIQEEKMHNLVSHENATMEIARISHSLVALITKVKKNTL